jgi:hypothetical protein
MAPVSERKSIGSDQKRVLKERGPKSEPEEQTPR